MIEFILMCFLLGMLLAKLSNILGPDEHKKRTGNSFYRDAHLFYTNPEKYLYDKEYQKKHGIIPRKDQIK